MREVTKEDGKKYTQTVKFAENDYPLLHVLSKKATWLMTTKPFSVEGIQGEADNPVDISLDEIIKPL